MNEEASAMSGYNPYAMFLRSQELRQQSRRAPIDIPEIVGEIGHLLGKDKAIRNPAFDASGGTTGDPYKSPGFWGRLLGNRGDQLNEAYRQFQDQERFARAASEREQANRVALLEKQLNAEKERQGASFTHEEVLQKAREAGLDTRSAAELANRLTVTEKQLTSEEKRAAQAGETQRQIERSRETGETFRQERELGAKTAEAEAERYAREKLERERENSPQALATAKYLEAGVPQRQAGAELSGQNAALLRGITSQMPGMSTGAIGPRPVGRIGPDGKMVPYNPAPAAPAQPPAQMPPAPDIRMNIPPISAGASPTPIPTYQQQQAGDRAAAPAAQPSPETLDTIRWLQDLFQPATNDQP